MAKGIYLSNIHKANSVIAQFKSNSQFYFLLALWFVAGAFLGPSYLLLIPITLLLLLRKQYYLEILLGFWFILILSDSTLRYMDFAKSFKSIFIVVLAVLVWLKRKDFYPYQNIFFKYFLPFLLWSFVVVSMAPEPFISAQKTLSYAMLLFLIPLLVAWCIHSEKERFYKGLMYFCAVIFIVGLILFVFVPHDIVFVEGRFKSFLGNPNGLGVFSSLVFLFFELVNHKHKNLFSKSEKWIFYGLIIGSLLFSQTRSALFAVVIYFLFSRIYFISGWIGFFTFLLLLFLYQPIINSVPFIISSLGLEDYLRLDTFSEGSGRLVAWTFAWEQIQENFYTGKGFNYADYLFEKNYPMLSRLGHEGNAHQAFLTFWLNTGIVGLFLYLFGIIASFWRVSKNNILAWPIFYSLLFMVSFESWLTSSLNPFTILLVIILSCMLFDNQTIDEEKSIDSNTIEA